MGLTPTKSTRNNQRLNEMLRWASKTLLYRLRTFKVDQNRQPFEPRANNKNFFFLSERVSVQFSLAISRIEAAT